MKILGVKELDDKFYSLIEEKKPDLFLEIGSYDAQTSNKVKGIVPDCKVVAYEASPYNYKKFLGTHQNDIEYLNLALSNYVGDTTFYVQLSNNGRLLPKTKKNNSILKRTESNVVYENIKVKVETIDNMFADEYNNIAMWIDVEGVGYEVLLGARALLERTNLIKIEVESREFWKEQYIDQKIISLLESLGFTYMYKDQERDGQYNIIFLKEN